jgi:hypothetical protein
MKYWGGRNAHKALRCVSGRSRDFSGYTEFQALTVTSAIIAAASKSDLVILASILLLLAQPESLELHRMILVPLEQQASTQDTDRDGDDKNFANGADAKKEDQKRCDDK